MKNVVPLVVYPEEFNICRTVVDGITEMLFFLFLFFYQSLWLPSTMLKLYGSCLHLEKLGGQNVSRLCR